MKIPVPARRNFRCACAAKTSRGHVVTRKPILPTEEEMETNSRAKSAKLRIFEKIES